MYQQHVIDWWASRGYWVTVLSDGALMCLSEVAVAQLDTEGRERLHVALTQRFAKKRST